MGFGDGADMEEREGLWKTLGILDRLVEQVDKEIQIVSDSFQFKDYRICKTGEDQGTKILNPTSQRV